MSKVQELSNEASISYPRVVSIHLPLSSLSGAGGAVAASNVSTTAVMAASTFSKNNARQEGGALAVTNSPSATIRLQSSTFSKNTVR